MTKTTPQTKDPAKDFITRAESKVPKALAAIANVGALSNRKSNTYTDTQVAIISNALQRQLDATIARFSAKDSSKPAFSLTASDEKKISG